MNPLYNIPILLFFFVVLPFVSNAESIDPLGQFCNQESVISKASPISSNINHVLIELVSKAPSTGFLTTSHGSGHDKVYGLAQCRGDVSQGDCLSCIQDAGKKIRQLCLDQADARIWYDYCFLRYNNKTFIGEVDTSFGIFYYNVEDVTDPEKFNKELGSLMDQIEADAVMPRNREFGKGQTKLTQFITLYALT